MSRESEWSWWAGRSTDWMDLGNYSTREDAIIGGKDSLGEGGGDFIIMEATMGILSMRADDILERFMDHVSDNHELYTGEGDYCARDGDKGFIAQADAELQVLLDGWMEKWRHTFTSPDAFVSTRNQETVSNTVDPDMLPGGHDNPREPLEDAS